MLEARMRVLIATDSAADQRKTLAAVRSLGQRGCEVIVGCDGGLCAPAWSRYCRRRVVYPAPHGAADGFVDAVHGLVREDAFDVLLPLSDHTTVQVSLHAHTLAREVGLCVPSSAALARAHDKAELLALARELGIAVPWTRCLEREEDLGRVAGEVEYPCVFKLRRGAGGVGLRFPSSEGELVACYRALRPLKDPVYDTRRPLVQELVPGSIHDACLLFEQGRVRAAMTQQRILMYPSRGGVGIHDVTTDEPELRDQAVALLEALQWHGPAMVEFLRDERDGRYKLMEINGRYWGTLDLAIRAGMDFPWLACRLATGGQVRLQTGYTKGLEYRWLIPFGLLYAREVRDLRRWWRFVRPRRARESELRATDPAPHLAEALATLGRARKRS
jgi:predicted ATP-grasp superfamily ATP-dependent carboligase